MNIPLDDAMEIDHVIPAPLVKPIEVRDSTGPSVIINDDDDVPTRTTRQVIPAPNNIQDYNDIEQEMIQAAIEASKKESEVVSFSKENDLYFCFFLVFILAYLFFFFFFIYRC